MSPLIFHLGELLSQNQRDRTWNGGGQELGRGENGELFFNKSFSLQVEKAPEISPFPTPPVLHVLVFGILLFQASKVSWEGISPWARQ